MSGLGQIATVISLDPFHAVTGAGSNLGERLFGSIKEMADERFLLLHRETS